MKKLRYLLLLLLSVCMIGAFAACGSGKKYTVTFETYGGTQIESYELQKGAKIKRPADPEKALFTFAGWYEDEEFTREFDFAQKMPANDITVYACWTSETSSRVSYNSMGGSAVAPSFGTVGSPITAPEDPTYEGYRFGGWYVDENYSKLFVFTTFPAESTTVYARWVNDPNYAYIDYVGNGSRLARVPVLKGETYSAPDFLGDGEEGLDAFRGQSVVLSDWYSDADLTQKYPFTAAASGNVTLYASYYSEGLEFSGGSVVHYNGFDSTVFIPGRIAGDEVPVTSVGDYAFAGNNNVSNISLPSSLRSVGEQAFYRCEYLVAVNLPAALTEIGKYAFFNCSRLTSYGDITGVNTIPEGLFLGCEKLPAVTLSQNATAVGAQAFADCENLTEVTLPAHVTAVPEGLFDGCTQLKKVVLPVSMTQFGMDAENEYAGRVFHGCVGLKEIVLDRSNSHYCVLDGNLYRTESGDPVELLYYVPGEKGDTEFRLPDSVLNVAAGAFNGNSSLESIVVTDPSVRIACGAFEGIRSLKSLTVPALEEGYLGYYFGAKEKQTAGKYSTSIPETLKSITFTSSVTEISDHAFYGAVGLEQVSGLASVVSIGNEAFAYTDLKTFEIPSGLVTLGSSVFSGCKALESFSMASASARYSVYDGCLYETDGSDVVLNMVPSAKTEISFPETVTQIGTAAFTDSVIEEIVVPSSVTLIKFGAFRGCNSLARLTVPFIGSSAETETYMGYVFGATVDILPDQHDTENNPFTGMELRNGNNIPLTLKSITVNRAYPEIPDGAFAYCRGLEEVKFPDGNAVTSIGAYAFFSAGISSWDFTGVKEIKDGAFRLSSLTSVSLPASLTYFGYASFAMVEPLKSITLAEGIQKIGAQAFYASGELNSTALRGIEFSSSFSGELVIPSTVTEIGPDAFFGLGMKFDGTRRNLPAADFSVRFAVNEEGTSALTKIGNGAFAYSALRTIAIPATVTEVGLQSFLYCDSLTKVEFGSATQMSRLTTIGPLAFSGCSVLEDFTMHVDKLVTMELYDYSSTTRRDVFYSASAKFVIHVPQNMVSIYMEADNWKTYASRISAIAQ